MKKIKIAVLVSFFLCFIALNAGAAETIQWYDYDKAKTIAETQNKKIFINFYADWCIYCKKMDKETFTDAKVIDYLNKYFISVKVDTMKEKKLASEYRVTGLPASHFLTEKGESIGALPGFMGPVIFLKRLEFVRNERYRK